MGRSLRCVFLLVLVLGMFYQSHADPQACTDAYSYAYGSAYGLFNDVKNNCIEKATNITVNVSLSWTSRLRAAAVCVASFNTSLSQIKTELAAKLAACLAQP
jgi:hypothetical protein